MLCQFVIHLSVILSNIMHESYENSISIKMNYAWDEPKILNYVHVNTLVLMRLQGYCSKMWGLCHSLFTNDYLQGHNFSNEEEL